MELINKSWSDFYTKHYASKWTFLVQALHVFKQEQRALSVVPKDVKHGDDDKHFLNAKGYGIPRGLNT